MPDARPVAFVNGVMLAMLAAVMLLPALADMASGGPDEKVFAGCAGFTAFVGVGQEGLAQVEAHARRARREQEQPAHTRARCLRGFGGGLQEHQVDRRSAVDERGEAPDDEGAYPPLDVGR